MFNIAVIVNTATVFFGALLGLKVEALSGPCFW